MTLIVTQYRRSYCVRMAIVTGIFVLIAAALLLVSRPYSRIILVPMGIVPLLFWLSVMVFTHLRGARSFDDTGVTRRDGKRLLWPDLQAVKRYWMVMKNGQRGPLNHTDLKFNQGKVRVFHFPLENAGEVLARLDEIESRVGAAVDPAPSAPIIAVPSADRANCPICTKLDDHQFGRQKHGYEQDDTFLPPEAGKLVFVRDLKPGANRSPELEKCPICGTFYVYRVYYDFLATGSEDEQVLVRLKSEDEAEKYIDM